MGHLPQEIAKTCHYFTRHDGKISRRVTGRQSHSEVYQLDAFDDMAHLLLGIVEESSETPVAVSYSEASEKSPSAFFAWH